MRRGRLEIVTIGPNPNLQLVGSDPAGGPFDLGLFILPGASSPITPTTRQLYMLAVKSFNMGQRGRLVGFRQYLTIGVNLPSTGASGPPFYPLERPIVTPTWKFVDGNVQWGIRKVPPRRHFQFDPAQIAGTSFEYSSTPALLFEQLTPEYIPPYGGLFPGNILTPELGRFWDIRSCSWCKPSKCNIPFEGPCDIAFMASVQQTNPTNRTNPPAIGSSPPIPVSQQISGAVALPTNSAIEHWYVVTTSGGTGVIGDLYFDNGSSVGSVAIITPFVGETIIPSTNFTGGTISLNAGVVYVWSGSAWVPAVGPSSATNQFLVTQGTTPEDAFIQNYPGAIYMRIAGALIFEMEEQAPTGMPKTYRRPGDGDRLTRDTTEVGDNTMRRSGEDTTEAKGCEDGDGDGKKLAPKRPASPPHVSGSLGKLHDEAVGFGKAPKESGNGSDGVINRLIRKWRNPGKAVPPRHQGLGKIPESKDVPVDPKSKRAINRILQDRKDRNGGTK